MVEGSPNLDIQKNWNSFSFSSLACYPLLRLAFQGWKTMPSLPWDVALHMAEAQQLEA
jgi:hypothetical protein